MSAWHWQQVPPGLLTARPSQLGPKKSAHSSIYEYVFFFWMMFLLGQSFDERELWIRICCLMHKRHRRALQIIYRPASRWGRWCRFFRHSMRWRQSDHHVAQWHKQTHTHTHTHTCTHAHTFSVMMKRAEWYCFFLSLFSFFFLMLTSISWVTCHSSRLFIMWHPGTNTPWHKQTNKQAQTHRAITFAHASLHWDVCPGHWCAIISAPRWTRMVVLSYTISWSSVHSYSVFLLGSLLPFSLPSNSFSQVNPPEYWLVVTTQRHISLHVFLFRQIYNGEMGDGETFEEACLLHTHTHTHTHSLSLSLSPSLSLSLSFSLNLPLFWSFWSFCVSTNILTNIFTLMLV